MTSRRDGRDERNDEPGAVSPAPVPRGRAPRPRAAAAVPRILDSITDGFLVLDRDWRISYLNARADALFRPLVRSDTELVGRNVWEALPDLRGSAVEAAFRRARSGDGTVELELYYAPLAGWFEIRVYPSPDGLSVLFQDVTRRKDAEGLLDCERRVLELIAGGAPADEALDALARGIEGLSVDGMLCSVLLLDAKTQCLMHGAAPSLPDDYNAAIHGLRIGPSVGSCGTAAYERTAVDVTDIASDPRWTPFRELAKRANLAACSSRPIFARDGPVLGTIAMYYRTPRAPSERDRALIDAATRLASILLEREAAERALRTSEAFNRSIIESSADCIKLVGLDGRIAWINARGRRAMDIPDSEAIGQRNWLDAWQDEDRKQAEQALHTAAAGGTAQFLAHYPVRGESRWWNVVVSPAGEGGRSPPQLLVVSRDVTERIRSEQSLREREAELRALADSIPQLAWTARADGHIFWFNRQWYEYTGTTPEAMEGWGWQSVHDPAVLPAVVERWRRSLESGTPFEMEFPLRGADGTFRTFLTRVNPVRDAEGRVIRWFGTNTDVEQVKRVRDALHEEKRLLELLNRTGTTLTSTLDLDELIQSITDIATQLCGASFGAFFYNTTDANGEAFMLYRLSGAPAEAFASLGRPRATELFGPTFRGEGIVRCDDVLADPRYGKMAPHHGMPKGHLPVRSYLAVPVIAGSGEVFGGLFFGHVDVGAFTERAERLVAAVAAQAAVAIDNARLYRASQRAAEEREALLTSERWARAEAERASRMKDEFLATLSHELRTPLSAILGWSTVLRTGRASEADLQTGLEAIDRNARAQTQLIEDLLDMSRIVSGKMRLDVQAVEPASFIQAAIESVRPAAVAKGIRLETFLDPAPVSVSGDPGRLQQVVWNLLSNAIKFTPKGGKVQIALERVNSHIAISVADTGIGIDPAFVDHVFEKFRQADASTTREFGGLGLGLSIVKHLVELHGGTVRAASAGRDQGATFTIELPVDVIRRESAPTRQHPRAAARSGLDLQRVDLSGVRVVVVDDQPDARELIARVLGECSASVVSCATAEDAIAEIARTPPTVLVSDIGMPGLDGYEFLRRVRELPAERGGKVPAIALTAFARSEDRTRALRSGFLVHLSKPVEPAELVATIASVTGRFASGPSA